MLHIRLVSNFTKEDDIFVLSNVKIVVENQEARRRVEVVSFEDTTHTGSSAFFLALRTSAVEAFTSGLLD